SSFAPPASGFVAHPTDNTTKTKKRITHLLMALHSAFHGFPAANLRKKRAALKKERRSYLKSCIFPLIFPQGNLHTKRNLRCFQPFSQDDPIWELRFA